VEVKGVVVGIYTNSYFMYKNDLAKFFTSFFPEFVLREILWLFIIAFSITLFNALPLPVFDGDRMVKELINWGIGEDYKDKRKKSVTFPFKKDEREYRFSEYRIEKVDSIKLKIKNPQNRAEESEVILAEDTYNLEDKINDGFADTLILNLPEQAKIGENSLIEVTYEYWYDRKKPIKRVILNIIRFVTLFIIIGNLSLSLIKFGALTFWF
jgi:membrane-associated protease RseP (regulator of RpoE activity)